MAEPYVVNFDYSDAPTLRNFSNCDKRIRVIVGPFRSGKSSASCFELYRRSLQQKPNSRGIRKTRWAVVRNTYPELKDTTIKTFLDWFPPEYFGHYRQNPNPDYQMSFPLPDGTMLESEFMFRALDKPEHVKNLLSLEVTGAYFNELREIPKIIFDTMDGRINQYPAMKDGGATWAGIIADTNPCDTDHWFYKLFVEDLPNNFIFQEKYAYFHQPSGRGPNAENLSHLPRNYYQDFCIGKDSQFISVYVDGQYGYVREGKVIYTNYLDSVHCAKETIKPIQGLPFILGWDFGLTPACVLLQYTPKGKLNILHELCATEMGIRTLAQNVVKPFLNGNYPGWKHISSCDPAGRNRSEIDETLSCIIELKNCGFNVKQAWTNALEPRFSSVDNFLIRQVEGGPALQLDPSCKLLRKGFNGEYKRRRLQISGEEIYSDAAEKNACSHPHEALQYAVMAIERGMRMYEKSGFATGGAVSQTPPPSQAWA